METRPLAGTGLDLSVLGFGASSIGAEFRPIDVPEALRCVRVAIDRGIDVSIAAIMQLAGVTAAEITKGQDRYVLLTVATVLIMGGLDKGGDFESLVQLVANRCRLLRGASLRSMQIPGNPCGPRQT